MFLITTSSCWYFPTMFISRGSISGSVLSTEGGGELGEKERGAVLCSSWAPQVPQVSPVSPVITHWTAALLLGILSFEVSLSVFPDGKRCCHKKQNFRETKAAILSRRKYQGYQTKFSNTILAYITEFPSFQRSKYVVTKMSISFATTPATFSINPTDFPIQGPSWRLPRYPPVYYPPKGCFPHSWDQHVCLLPIAQA